jgi:hypothetical protein
MMPQTHNACNNQNSSIKNEIPKLHVRKNCPRTLSSKTIATIENTKDQQHSSATKLVPNYKQLEKLLK